MSNIEVWPIKMMKVRDLVPNEDNPRTISAAKLEKLKNQILSVGFNTPPKIDNDGVLLGGNSRFRVLIAAGAGDLEIPVMYPPKKLTKKERQEIIVTDNVNDGEWDFELLANDFEIQDLIDWGLPMSSIADHEPDVDLQVDDPSDAINNSEHLECPKCGYLIREKK
jgi:hypothetical protein